jgi:hypothetical protein
MLKEYFFWGGLIAVLIGIIVSLVKRRERGRRWQNPPPPAGAQVVPSPDRRTADMPITGTPRLVCLDGSHHGHRFDIPPRGLSIGRAKDNDLIIVDGRISAHHAWIGIVGDSVLLRDYQSLNGTFLNADMNAPVTEAALTNGDTIYFGGHRGDRFRLVFE